MGLAFSMFSSRKGLLQILPAKEFGPVGSKRRDFSAVAEYYPIGGEIRPHPPGLPEEL